MVIEAPSSCAALGPFGKGVSLVRQSNDLDERSDGGFLMELEGERPRNIVRISVSVSSLPTHTCHRDQGGDGGAGAGIKSRELGQTP